MSEDQLIVDYVKVRKQYEEISNLVDKHFSAIWPGVIATGDFQAMTALMDRIPDHVCKCFYIDALRQSGYDIRFGEVYDKQAYEDERMRKALAQVEAVERAEQEKANQ